MIFLPSPRYKIKGKIGEGSFGQIYSASDVTLCKEVALKVEECKKDMKQLQNEAALYRLFQGSPETPRFYGFSREGSHNMLSIELMGKSLEAHLDENKRKLSLKTVLMLADQMISCIQYVHSKNYIHRDIKPDNFVMGRGARENKVYLIDFGLSKLYVDHSTMKHIEWSDGNSLSGTARYASVSALRGIEQSRRDDMEALGYVFVYLLKGTLPWVGFKDKDGKKNERILEMKVQTKISDLCKGYSGEFEQYFKEIKKLHFDEKPNYALYRKMFRSLFINLGYVYDSMYDWSSKRPSSSQTIVRKSNKVIPRKRLVETPSPLIRSMKDSSNNPKENGEEESEASSETDSKIDWFLNTPISLNETKEKHITLRNELSPTSMKRSESAYKPVYIKSQPETILKVQKNYSYGFVPPPEPPKLGNYYESIRGFSRSTPF